MEVEGGRLVQRAVVARGVESFGQLGAAHALPVDAQHVGHQALVAVEDAVVVEPVGEVDAFVAGVALDAVLRDAAADGLDRVQREPVQLAPRLGADRIEHAALAQRKAAEHEATIAAGGAIADALGFQQHDVGVAALHQRDGGGQARKAAADDADRRIACSSEWRPGGCAGGRAVVAFPG